MATEADTGETILLKEKCLNPGELLQPPETVVHLVKSVIVEVASNVDVEIVTSSCEGNAGVTAGESFSESPSIAKVPDQETNTKQETHQTKEISYQAEEEKIEKEASPESTEVKETKEREIVDEINEKAAVDDTAHQSSDTTGISLKMENIEEQYLEVVKEETSKEEMLVNHVEAEHNAGSAETITTEENSTDRVSEGVQGEKIDACSSLLEEEKSPNVAKQIEEKEEEDIIHDSIGEASVIPETSTEIQINNRENSLIVEDAKDKLDSQSVTLEIDRPSMQEEASNVASAEKSRHETKLSEETNDIISSVDQTEEKNHAELSSDTKTKELSLLEVDETERSKMVTETSLENYVKESPQVTMTEAIGIKSEANGREGEKIIDEAITEGKTDSLVQHEDGEKVIDEEMIISDAAALDYRYKDRDSVKAGEENVSQPITAPESNQEESGKEKNLSSMELDEKTEIAETELDSTNFGETHLLEQETILVESKELGQGSNLEPQGQLQEASEDRYDTTQNENDSQACESTENTASEVVTTEQKSTSSENEIEKLENIHSLVSRDQPEIKDGEMSINEDKHDNEEACDTEKPKSVITGDDSTICHTGESSSDTISSTEQKFQTESLNESATEIKDIEVEKTSTANDQNLSSMELDQKIETAETEFDSKISGEAQLLEQETTLVESKELVQDSNLEPQGQPQEPSEDRYDTTQNENDSHAHENTENTENRAVTTQQKSATSENEIEKLEKLNSLGSQDQPEVKDEEMSINEDKHEKEEACDTEKPMSVITDDDSTKHHTEKSVMETISSTEQNFQAGSLHESVTALKDEEVEKTSTKNDQIASIDKVTDEEAVHVNGTNLPSEVIDEETVESCLQIDKEADVSEVVDTKEQIIDGTSTSKISVEVVEEAPVKNVGNVENNVGNPSSREMLLEPQTAGTVHIYKNRDSVEAEENISQAVTALPSDQEESGKEKNLSLMELDQKTETTDTDFDNKNSGETHFLEQETTLVENKELGQDSNLEPQGQPQEPSEDRYDTTQNENDSQASENTENPANGAVTTEQKSTTSENEIEKSEKLHSLESQDQPEIKDEEMIINEAKHEKEEACDTEKPKSVITDDDGTQRHTDESVSETISSTEQNFQAGSVHESVTALKDEEVEKTSTTNDQITSIEKVTDEEAIHVNRTNLSSEVINETVESCLQIDKGADVSQVVDTHEQIIEGTGTAKISVEVVEEAPVISENDENIVDNPSSREMLLEPETAGTVDIYKDRDSIEAGEENISQAVTALPSNQEESGNEKNLSSMELDQKTETTETEFDDKNYGETHLLEQESTLVENKELSQDSSLEPQSQPQEASEDKYDTTQNENDSQASENTENPANGAATTEQKSTSENEIEKSEKLHSLESQDQPEIKDGEMSINEDKHDKEEACDTEKPKSVITDDGSTQRHTDEALSETINSTEQNFQAGSLHESVTALKDEEVEKTNITNDQITRIEKVTDEEAIHVNGTNLSSEVINEETVESCQQIDKEVDAFRIEDTKEQIIEGTSTENISVEDVEDAPVKNSENDGSVDNIRDEILKEENLPSRELNENTEITEGETLDKKVNELNEAHALEKELREVTTFETRETFHEENGKDDEKKNEETDSQACKGSEVIDSEHPSVEEAENTETSEAKIEKSEKVHEPESKEEMENKDSQMSIEENFGNKEESSKEDIQNLATSHDTDRYHAEEVLNDAKVEQNFQVEVTSTTSEGEEISSQTISVTDKEIMGIDEVNDKESIKENFTQLSSKVTGDETEEISKQAEKEEDETTGENVEEKIILQNSPGEETTKNFQSDDKSSDNPSSGQNFEEPETAETITSIADEAKKTDHSTPESSIVAGHESLLSENRTVNDGSPAEEIVVDGSSIKEAADRENYYELTEAEDHSKESMEEEDTDKSHEISLENEAESLSQIDNIKVKEISLSPQENEERVETREKEDVLLEGEEDAKQIFQNDNIGLETKTEALSKTDDSTETETAESPQENEENDAGRGKEDDTNESNSRSLQQESVAQNSAQDFENDDSIEKSNTEIMESEAAERGDKIMHEANQSNATIPSSLVKEEESLQFEDKGIPEESSLEEKRDEGSSVVLLEEEIKEINKHTSKPVQFSLEMNQNEESLNSFVQTSAEDAKHTLQEEPQEKREEPLNNAEYTAVRPQDGEGDAETAQHENIVNENLPLGHVAQDLIQNSTNDGDAAEKSDAEILDQPKAAESDEDNTLETARKDSSNAITPTAPVEDLESLNYEKKDVAVESSEEDKKEEPSLVIQDEDKDSIILNEENKNEGGQETSKTSDSSSREMKENEESLNSSIQASVVREEETPGSDNLTPAEASTKPDEEVENYTGLRDAGEHKELLEKEDAEEKLQDVVSQDPVKNFKHDDDGAENSNEKSLEQPKGEESVENITDDNQNDSDNATNPAAPAEDIESLHCEDKNIAKEASADEKKEEPSSINTSENSNGRITMIEENNKDGGLLTSKTDDYSSHEMTDTEESLNSSIQTSLLREEAPISDKIIPVEATNKKDEDKESYPVLIEVEEHKELLEKEEGAETILQKDEPKEHIKESSNVISVETEAEVSSEFKETVESPQDNAKTDAGREKKVIDESSTGSLPLESVAKNPETDDCKDKIDESFQDNATNTKIPVEEKEEDPKEHVIDNSDMKNISIDPVDQGTTNDLENDEHNDEISNKEILEKFAKGEMSEIIALETNQNSEITDSICLQDESDNANLEEPLLEVKKEDDGSSPKASQLNGSSVELAEAIKQSDAVSNFAQNEPQEFLESSSNVITQVSEIAILDKKADEISILEEVQNVQTNEKTEEEETKESEDSNRSKVTDVSANEDIEVTAETHAKEVVEEKLVTNETDSETTKACVSDYSEKLDGVHKSETKEEEMNEDNVIKGGNTACMNEDTEKHIPMEENLSRDISPQPGGEETTLIPGNEAPVETYRGVELTSITEDTIQQVPEEVHIAKDQSTESASVIADDKSVMIPKTENLESVEPNVNLDHTSEIGQSDKSSITIPETSSNKYENQGSESVEQRSQGSPGSGQEIIEEKIEPNLKIKDPINETRDIEDIKASMLTEEMYKEVEKAEGDETVEHLNKDGDEIKEVQSESIGDEIVHEVEESGLVSSEYLATTDSNEQTEIGSLEVREAHDSKIESAVTKEDFEVTKEVIEEQLIEDTENSSDKKNQDSTLEATSEPKLEEVQIDEKPAMVPDISSDASSPHAAENDPGQQDILALEENPSNLPSQLPTDDQENVILENVALENPAVGDTEESKETCETKNHDIQELNAGEVREGIKEADEIVLRSQEKETVTETEAATDQNFPEEIIKEPEVPSLALACSEDDCRTETKIENIEEHSEKIEMTDKSTENSSILKTVEDRSLQIENPQMLDVSQLDLQVKGPPDSPTEEHREKGETICDNREESEEGSRIESQSKCYSLGETALNEVADDQSLHNEKTEDGRRKSEEACLPEEDASELQVSEPDLEPKKDTEESSNEAHKEEIVSSVGTENKEEVFVSNLDSISKGREAAEVEKEETTPVHTNYADKSQEENLMPSYPLLSKDPEGEASTIIGTIEEKTKEIQVLEDEPNTIQEACLQKEEARDLKVSSYEFQAQKDEQENLKEIQDKEDGARDGLKEETEEVSELLLKSSSQDCPAVSEDKNTSHQPQPTEISKEQNSTYVAGLLFEKVHDISTNEETVKGETTREEVPENAPKTIEELSLQKEEPREFKPSELEIQMGDDIQNESQKEVQDAKNMTAEESWKLQSQHEIEKNEAEKMDLAALENGGEKTTIATEVVHTQVTNEQIMEEKSDTKTSHAIIGEDATKESHVDNQLVIEGTLVYKILEKEIENKEIPQEFAKADHSETTTKQISAEIGPVEPFLQNECDTIETIVQTGWELTNENQYDEATTRDRSVDSLEKGLSLEKSQKEGTAVEATEINPNIHQQEKTSEGTLKDQKEPETMASTGKKEVLEVQQESNVEIAKITEDKQMQPARIAAPDSESQSTEHSVDDENRKATEETVSKDSTTISLQEMLQRSRRESEAATSKEENKAEKQTSNTEKAKSDEEIAEEEDENEEDDEEDETKKNDSGSDAPVMVESSRDIEVKIAQKKSHNILSGVGSKVKHSIIKVKKAITGKTSQTKQHSPK